MDGKYIGPREHNMEARMTTRGEKFTSNTENTKGKLSISGPEMATLLLGCIILKGLCETLIHSYVAMYSNNSPKVVRT